MHYFFDVESLNLEKLLSKPSYSSMGRIDMFALLKSLLPRLLDILGLMGIHSALYLRKLGHNSVNYNKKYKI